MISWEDYTLVISFRVEGFSLQSQNEKLFIVMVYNVYAQHVTLSTFSSISLLLTATYFYKARYNLFVLKVKLNPNQSILLTYARIHVVMRKIYTVC